MDDSKFYGLLVLTTGRTSEPSRLPQLHLNLWEKSGTFYRESAFLDIGLMLDIEDTARTFEFVLPWVVKISDLEDLSHRVLEKGAIPAIFNEIWVTSTSNGSAGYVSDPVDGVFTIVHTHSDLHVQKHDTGNQQSQITIQLNVQAIRERSRAASKEAKRMYVRFRVKHVPRSFYRVSISPRDRILLSSWQRTEIIDFRMNVRRGIPLGFDQMLKATFADFSKVHLFLMKSRDQDIVFEDKWFRSCRSLEDEDFWASYSLVPKASDWRIFWSKRHVKSSLGYQWTRVSQKDLTTGGVVPVREFGTLARFKKIRFGVMSFIVVASLVGAGGNAVWDAVKYRYDRSTAAAILHKWLQPSEIPKGEGE